MFNSVEYVLDTIFQRVDEDKKFKIQISTANILERDLLQWQYQKNNSPFATLSMTFFGDARVDTRAFQKEFLTGKTKNKIIALLCRL